MSNKLINNICITSGNLGINTTNPLYPVHLTGINNTSGVLYCNNTSATSLSIGVQTNATTNISVLQSSIKANNVNSLIEIGKTPLSTHNMGQIYYTNVADGSTSNNIRIGTYGASNQIAFLANSYVGIATATPIAPLHIGTYMTQTIPPVYYMSAVSSATTGNQWTGGGAGNYGVYANQRVLTYTYFLATSDKRIKKDIVSIDTSFALDTITKLNPVKYEYIDKVRKSETTLGFIAQEVDSIVSNVVSKVKDYIPNIFSLAKVQNDVLILQNQINQTTNETNTNETNTYETNTYDTKVNVGDELQLYKSDDSSIIVKITEIIDNSTIRIDQTIDDTSVFVFGTEKSDFNVINYNSLFSVSIAALKELDKQIQENMLIEQEIESLISDINIGLNSVSA